MPKALVFIQMSFIPHLVLSILFVSCFEAENLVRVFLPPFRSSSLLDISCGFDPDYEKNSSLVLKIPVWSIRNLWLVITSAWDSPCIYRISFRFFLWQRHWDSKWTTYLSGSCLFRRSFENAVFVCELGAELIIRHLTIIAGHRCPHVDVWYVHLL